MPVLQLRWPARTCDDFIIQPSLLWVPVTGGAIPWDRLYHQLAGVISGPVGKQEEMNIYCVPPVCLQSNKQGPPFIVSCKVDLLLFYGQGDRGPRTASGLLQSHTTAGSQVR